MTGLRLTSFTLVRPRRARRGFSTIELLGAIVVSMVMSIVAVAGFQVYQRELPLRSAASRLSHAFGSARTMAISRNSTFTVQIDSRYGSFWIDETDQTGTPLVLKITSPEQLGERVELLSVFPSPIGEIKPVRFFADGSSDDIKVILHLRGDQANRPQDYATVRLYGPTGQSRVFDSFLPLDNATGQVNP